MKKILFSSLIAATVIITVLSTLFVAPYLSTVGGVGAPPHTANGTFYWPRDVALNSTGYIFVADTQNSRGQIFNASGTFITTFGFPGNSQTDGSLNQPFGLFVNSSNFIHVADTFTNVLKVYDPNGNYVKTIGSPGQGLNNYYYPSGWTGNSTHFFVADTFNNRIIITDLSGNSVAQIPEVVP